MRVVTYLGFTVLSIFIQFCVMDFIKEKINIEENPEEVNISTRKKIVEDFLINITNKPHALYYRTLKSKSLQKSHPATSRFSERIFSNSSVPTVPSGTTDLSTTVFDILYDENTSVTETTQTTESFYTNTEFDNVTEITFFESRNKSSAIPNNVPKINFKNYCGCNLLFRVCDINCCCDPDCSKDELKQFQCEKKNNDGLSNDGCISHLLHGDLRWSSSLDSLFCIVKTNLPDKRNIQKPNLVLAAHHHKWKDVHQQQKTYEFKKMLYQQADPIWLLRNGTIYYFDVPTPMVNNYCTDRAPIGFLNEEKITCIVKFNDLEMFHISKTESSMLISATERTINSTVLNCSNLHCINWTILTCDNSICKNYNKSIDAPSCTESNCINVAFKIDYNFYYYDFKIINATIKLHIQKVLYNVLPFMSQEITVKFIMANKSLDNVIKFSGNPGYINHLQLIISKAKSNFTDGFFNNTPTKNYWTLPENQNGMCTLSNMSKNFVRFNLNKRTKCRYVHTHRISTQNYTSACKSIQDDINALLGLNREVSIAPFGNPYGVNDKDWIKMQTNIHSPVYGEYSEHTSKLHCYNLVQRVSLLFVFASVDEKDFVGQNKILSAKYEVLPMNRSFNIEDISIVLTIDANFVDATTPHLYVYASSPYLSIHLPKDFFFPFPPNNGSLVSNTYIVAILCSIITFFK